MSGGGGGGGSFRGRGYGQRTRPTSNGFGGPRFPHPNVKQQNRNRGAGRPPSGGSDWQSRDNGDGRGPPNNRPYQPWRQRPDGRPQQSFPKGSYPRQPPFESAWDRTSSNDRLSDRSDRSGDRSDRLDRDRERDRDRDRDRERDRDKDRDRDRSDRFDRSDRPYQNYRGRGNNARGPNLRYPGPGRPYSYSNRRSSPYRSPSSLSPPPDKPQEPLLGSEEERLQKITETAAKLKKSLSSITDEERVTFWEQDLIEATTAVSTDDPPTNSASQEDCPARGSSGIPELRHEPPELKLTQDDFKDIGRRVESDPTSKVDFNEFSLSSKEPFDETQLIVDSVGNPEMDDFGMPHDLLSGEYGDGHMVAHVEEVPMCSADQTVTPLEEPIDFDNVMHILQAGSSEQSQDTMDSAAANICDPVTASGEESQQPLSDQDQSSPSKLSKSEPCSESLASSQYEPSSSTTRTKTTRTSRTTKTTKTTSTTTVATATTATAPVVAMCPPPSTTANFSSSNFTPTLGYTPRLSTPWPASFDELPNDFSKPPPALPNTKLPPRNIAAVGGDPLKKNEPDVLQPPPAFDPRKPLGTSTEKKDEVRQPPLIFDPRLSMTERSTLMLSGATTPLDANKTSMPPPPVMMPTYPSYIPPVQMGYAAVPMAHPVPTAPLPVPPLPTPEPIPPLPFAVSGLTSTASTLTAPPAPTTAGLSISFDEDGLEEMQEAMEFAQQLMSMSDDKPATTSTAPAAVTTATSVVAPVIAPVAAPVIAPVIAPIATSVAGTLVAAVLDPATAAALVVAAPKPISPPVLHSTDSNSSLPKMSAPLLVTATSTMASAAPTSVGIEPATLEQAAQMCPGMDILKVSQTIPMDKHMAEDLMKHASLVNPTASTTTLPLVTVPLTSGAVPLVGTTTVPLAGTVPLLGIVASSVQSPTDTGSTDSRKAVKALEKKPRKESSQEANWKHRVINRFLKMSKNEIRNMLNHSSLRKFDIAMNRLVKEKKSSINQEIRMTEDERIKEYDREEFMNQLNAMLDPNATVDISNLPTEFIHHLNVVLQLDPLQFEATASTSATAIPTTAAAQPAFVAETVSLAELGITALQPELATTVQHLQPDMPVLTTHQEVRRKREPKPVAESVPQPHHKEKRKVTVKVIRDDPKQKAEAFRQEQRLKFQQQMAKAASNRARMTSTSTQIDSEYTQYTATQDYILREHAKINVQPDEPQENPVVNMADIDDIFSAGIAKVRQAAKAPSPQSGTRREHNENRPAFNLDDIFSAGIAKAKSSTASDETRSKHRQSDTDFETDLVERWMRKEREHIDAYRNLTKEEWDAKYGKTMDRGAFERELEVTVSEFTKMQGLRLNDDDATLNEHHIHDSSHSDEDSTSTSSSNSDQETSPDVTQLLKVIKESEKIAKKKSINETIRDEVAAEIERKWREKNKQKERKAKKRARRKKDKKERKKRSRKKHKKRSRNTDSESDEDMPNKLLTEDEIKKEIKEEPEVAATLAAVGGRTVLFKNPVNRLDPKNIGVARPYPLKSRQTQAKQNENTGITRKVTFSDKVIQHEISDKIIIRKPFDSKALTKPAAIIGQSVLKNAPQSAMKAALRTAAKTAAAAAQSVKAPTTQVVIAKSMTTATTTVSVTMPAAQATEKTIAAVAAVAQKANAVAFAEKAAPATTVKSFTNKAATSDTTVNSEKPAITTTLTDVVAATVVTASPVTVKVTPMEVKTTPTEVKTIPAEVKAMPAKIKATPAEVKVTLAAVTPAVTAEISQADVSPQENEQEILKSIKQACKENLKTVDPELKDIVKVDDSLTEESESTKTTVSAATEVKQPVQESAKTEAITEIKSSDPKKSKKLDINAYKARVLERKKKEQEKLKNLENNPVSLTHDLLNIPSNKRDGESSQDTTKPPVSSNIVAVKSTKPHTKPVKLKRTSMHERMKEKAELEKENKSAKKSESEEVTQAVTTEDAADEKSSVTKCAAGHSPTKADGKTSDKQKKKKKVCKACEADSHKFKNIKSEGSKELKLKSPKSKVVEKQEPKDVSRESATSDLTVNEKPQSTPDQTTEGKPALNDALTKKSDIHADISIDLAKTDSIPVLVDSSCIETEVIDSPMEIGDDVVVVLPSDGIVGEFIIEPVLTSDGLPDTVPDEDINKYIEMGINVTPLLTEIDELGRPEVENPCSMKDPFFENAALVDEDDLKTDGIFTVNEIELSSECAPLEMDAINPIDSALQDVLTNEIVQDAGTIVPTTYIVEPTFNTPDESIQSTKLPSKILELGETSSMDASSTSSVNSPFKTVSGDSITLGATKVPHDRMKESIKREPSPDIDNIEVLIQDFVDEINEGHKETGLEELKTVQTEDMMQESNKKELIIDSVVNDSEAKTIENIEKENLENQNKDKNLDNQIEDEVETLDETVAMDESIVLEESIEKDMEIKEPEDLQAEKVTEKQKQVEEYIDDLISVCKITEQVTDEKIELENVAAKIENIEDSISNQVDSFEEFHQKLQQIESSRDNELSSENINKGDILQNELSNIANPKTVEDVETNKLTSNIEVRSQNMDDNVTENVRASNTGMQDFSNLEEQLQKNENQIEITVPSSTKNSSAVERIMQEEESLQDAISEEVVYPVTTESNDTMNLLTDLQNFTKSETGSTQEPLCKEQTDRLMKSQTSLEVKSKESISMETPTVSIASTQILHSNAILESFRKPCEPFYEDISNSPNPQLESETSVYYKEPSSLVHKRLEPAEIMKEETLDSTSSAIEIDTAYEGFSHKSSPTYVIINEESRPIQDPNQELESPLSPEPEETIEPDEEIEGFGETSEEENVCERITPSPYQIMDCENERIVKNPSPPPTGEEKSKNDLEEQINERESLQDLEPVLEVFGDPKHEEIPVIIAEDPILPTIITTEPISINLDDPIEKSLLLLDSDAKVVSLPCEPEHVAITAETFESADKPTSDFIDVAQPITSCIDSATIATTTTTAQHRSRPTLISDTILKTPITLIHITKDGNKKLNRVDVPADLATTCTQIAAAHQKQIIDASDRMKPIVATAVSIENKDKETAIYAESDERVGAEVGEEGEQAAATCATILDDERTMAHHVEQILPLEESKIIISETEQVIDATEAIKITEDNEFLQSDLVKTFPVATESEPVKIEQKSDSEEERNKDQKAEGNPTKSVFELGKQEPFVLLEKSENVEHLVSEMKMKKLDPDRNLHKIHKKQKTKHKHKSTTIPTTMSIENLTNEQVVKPIQFHTRDTVVARLYEIDQEVVKLMNEKMKLYEMLNSGNFGAQSEITENKETEYLLGKAPILPSMTPLSTGYAFTSFATPMMPNLATTAVDKSIKKSVQEIPRDENIVQDKMPEKGNVQEAKVTASEQEMDKSEHHESRRKDKKRKKKKRNKSKSRDRSSSSQKLSSSREQSVDKEKLLKSPHKMSETMTYKSSRESINVKNSKKSKKITHATETRPKSRLRKTSTGTGDETESEDSIRKSNIASKALKKSKLLTDKASNKDSDVKDQSDDTDRDSFKKSSTVHATGVYSQANVNEMEKTKTSKINEEKAKDSSDDSSTDLVTKLKIKQLRSRPKSRAGKELRVSSDSEEDNEEKSQKAAETSKHSQSNANKIAKAKSSKVNEEKAKDLSGDSSTDLGTKKKTVRLTSRPKSRAGKMLRVSSDIEEDVKEKSQKAAETTDHYETNENKIEKIKSSKIDEEKAKDSSDDSSTDLATKLKIKKLTSRPKSRAGKILKDSSDSEEDVKEKPRKVSSQRPQSRMGKASKKSKTSKQLKSKETIESDDDSEIEHLSKRSSSPKHTSRPKSRAGTFSKNLIDTDEDQKKKSDNESISSQTKKESNKRPQSRMGKNIKSKSPVKSKSVKEKSTNKFDSDSEVENYTRNRSPSPKPIPRSKSRAGKMIKDDSDKDDFKKKSDSESILSRSKMEPTSRSKSRMGKTTRNKSPEKRIEKFAKGLLDSDNDDENLKKSEAESKSNRNKTGVSERPKSRMGKSHRSTSREKLKNKTKVDNDSEAETVSRNRSTSPKQTLRSRSRTRELSRSSLASEDDGVYKKSDVEFAESARRPKSRAGRITKSKSPEKSMVMKENFSKKDNDSEVNTSARSRSTSPKPIFRPKSRMRKLSKSSTESNDDKEVPDTKSDFSNKIETIEHSQNEAEEATKSKFSQKLSQPSEEKSTEKSQEKARNIAEAIAKDFSDDDSEVPGSKHERTSSPKPILILESEKPVEAEQVTSDSTVGDADKHLHNTEDKSSKNKIVKVEKQKGLENALAGDISEDDNEITAITEKRKISSLSSARSKSRMGKIIKDNDKKKDTSDSESSKKESASRPKSRAAKKLKVDEVNKDTIQRPKSRAAKTSKTNDESTASTIASSTDSKQKDSEENIPRQVQKVKNTQKTIIYSDDSTMDTFEQASNVTKSSGKGLALLEESLKKESKKKKSSLKFLLNPQVEPEEESELSSDLEDDEGSTTVAAKRKLKTVTEETLRHYDEVIDFVVKNTGQRSSSSEIHRTENVMNDEQEKKEVEREPKISIKTDAKTKTSVADLELDEISEGDLDEKQLISKKSHITEEKMSAKNSNKINAKVSDIKKNDDTNSEKLPTKEALQSDVNIEDKEDRNNEIQSDEGDDNDIDAPFTYGGSPYVVLDNLEEPPESEHPAEEDNVCKDTVPFTYEGMPLPKEVIDSCSSIGSGSNYPSPKPSDLPIENIEESKVKKNARDNESQKAKDEDDSNQSHVDVVTVDNVENEANTRKENIILKDAVISDKESDIEVNVDDGESNKITNKLETIPEETHSQDEAENTTDDKDVAKKIKETDTVIKSKLKGKKSIKETEIASEKIKKSNETSKHVTDDSSSEKSLKANESEKESDEDLKSERSVKIRGRKRKTSKEDNRTVPKRQKSSKTMEEITKESTQKRGDKSRRQKSIEEELLESETNLKKRRGRPSSANARGRSVEVHAKRNLKRKVPMSHAEMKSCKVRVVDCKFTLLQPNVHPNILLTAGISRIRNLKVLSIKNPISKLKETNTDVTSKQMNVESKSILEHKKKDIEPASTKRTEIHIPQKIVRSDLDTHETIKSELNKQPSDNDIESDNDIDDDKLPEKLNEKESQTTGCENKLSKKDDVDSEQKITSKLAKENELEILTPITEKTEEIIVESEVIVKQVTTKSVIVLDNIKTTNTSIESTQEKRSQLHQVEERPMAEAQVLVEKMILPVKTSHVETSKPSSSIEVEGKKPKRIEYTNHKGPILNIKVFEDSFLAASDDGSVYRYDIATNTLLNIFAGHTSAVTCLCISRFDDGETKKELLYSGSLDGSLRCYNIRTGLGMQANEVGSAVQCMDQAWGTIFIGTKSGTIARFNIKTGCLKPDSIQSSEKLIMALKATNEGARRVLIVASRNQKLTIRDAVTGLILRTISGQKNYTIYSLLRDHSLIYCGTSSASIPVFDFISGEQTVQYNASVGIVCMCLHKKLLFAGCYDGNIYVFNTTNHTLICRIPGPGNMLLSMELVGRKIISGSKDKNLHVWDMPEQIQEVLDEQ